MASPRVTELLQRWSAGDQRAADEVLPLVYRELRRIAAREFRRERPGHTLQATAVVHEAYLRLRGESGLLWESRAQFFAFAARLVRRILVEHARKRACAKRGGRATKVTLTEAASAGSSGTTSLVALDDALTNLAGLDARKAAIVELRFFGGLTIEETAAELGVSAETVGREWRRAKAWLYSELQRTEEAARGR